MNMGGVNFSQFLRCEVSGPGHVWDPHGFFVQADDDQIHCSSCGIGADDLRGLRAWLRNMISEARAFELWRANRALRISAPRFKIDAETATRSGIGSAMNVFQPLEFRLPPV